MAKKDIVTIVERRITKSLKDAGLLPNDRVIVGVSGGPDSLTALYALTRIQQDLYLRLHVGHINHQLRGIESTLDSQFVQQICNQLNIPITVTTVDVNTYRNSKGLSLEEAARDLRYDVLFGLSVKYAAAGIVLGHTADDHAETVLMNILRGTSLTGLRGIQPDTTHIFNDAPVKLLRPMLEISREETNMYCVKLELKPREDLSNKSMNIRRNRVRLELIPLLEKTYNPSIKNALKRLSVSASRDIDYLDEQIDSMWNQAAVINDGYVILDRKFILPLALSLQTRLFRRAIFTILGNLKDIEFNHVNAIVQLLYARSQKTITLPQKIQVTATPSDIVISHEEVDLCPLPLVNGPQVVNIPGETTIEGWHITANLVSPVGKLRSNRDPYCINQNAVLGSQILDTPLYVRSWLAGDRFQPLGMSGSKKLQDFFVDKKIPRSWRGRIPLLVGRQGIAWVVGFNIAEWAKVIDCASPALGMCFQRNSQPKTPT